ncbi:aspartate/glutamate racemase family protein (plasmid) [Agrobacterium vitis]|uniref:aspartate/glutamate racemase family protein n=1 Tax=Rhizobium/Agrobacterium group TaxID=227290 RepID=UPI0020339CA7|nr:amino acid racemase [Rhizobium sp. CG5]MCM2476127.1 aspartate/glutamate racemase family protein [Rhizobium sp. CG5]
MLGVLGGMGPLATVDFLTKLIENTPASCDQDHIETIVSSASHTPDRSSAIIGTGEDPYPHMKKALVGLERCGADIIAIPCNTAHYWHAALQKETKLPILHIVDAVVDQFESSRCNNGVVGILATTGTIQAGVYQTRLLNRGYGYVAPALHSQSDVMHAIRLVKAGQLALASKILSVQARLLMDAGCTVIAMACTEIPLALADISSDLAPFLVDPTKALARACIQAAGLEPVKLSVI